MRKKIAGILLCCALMSAGSFTVNAMEGEQTDTVLNGWVEESDGRHYYIEGTEVTSQGIKIEEEWYYFNENGVSMCNWFRQKGEDWFYYDENGCLVTNEELDINGEHYKFQSSGAAYRGWDETEAGRYYYTEDGSRAAGEGLKIGGYWYYFKEDGQILTGWREKGDGYYYYDENGHLLTGQGIEIEGKWYYLSSSGRRLQSEFRQKGEDRFYYDENGWLVKNVELDINGEHYKFQSSGAAYRGWDETETGRYYYTEDGSRAAGEGLKIGGYWYYFKEDGQILTGWREKGDGYYYYDENGHLLTGQGIEIEGKWYYLSSSGRRLQSEFRQKGEDWFYYDENGWLVKNLDTVIDGYRYIFQSSGAAYRGLMTENGKVIGFDPYGRQAFDAGVKDHGYWYYFDSTGTMMKNWWRTKDGGKYYYQSDGKLAVNVGLEIDGYWYYFTSSGKMHTGWRDKGNDRYYYDSNGHLVTNCTMVIDGVEYEFDSAGRVKNYPRRIAVFSTVSTNTYNGTYNMTKALLSFNQVVIQPGQTLSFFGVAGPCGAAQGYLPAGVVGGIGYGGGICQASTTLYGAAIRAGLTIVERSNHSVPSTYVPIGQDAMVNYGTNDLKIRNDYNYPVKFVTYVSGNTLYAEVWGIQPSWFDYIQINSWWTGSRSAAANRQYIKNGVVVRTEALPSSYY
ncbi:VanW family protein [Clostridium sp. Marseille-P3244]|uniref:VanW family protein n=1 Tax=Clostridium sp. Marseille-P3244 TaxID=1871020 RepID=UPI00092FDB70|nr:VanW family protein [Clostridium sp. Marseille-P3244]